MATLAGTFDPLEAKRREQMPQALARLAVVGLFIALWVILWVARIPMPVPFLAVLIIEALFFLGYCRIMGLLRSVRALEFAQYGMLTAEIVFHTTMVYFLGGISWLGPFAYVFGLIFTNAFLDLRRGLIYTSGVGAAFVSLVLLDATGTIPHYQYLAQGPLRHTDARLVTTTIVGALGVFLSIDLWINWVGHELRQQRDRAVRSQNDLLRARAELQRTNEELEQRVAERTADLELANAALRESEERLRAVVSNAPVILFSMDRDGVITLSEGRALETLGLKPGEVVGRSVYEMYRDVPAVLESIRRALAGEAFTSTVEAGDLAFEAHYAPVHNENGEMAGLIGVASDVTERVRAERALREREARNRALLEANPDMIVRIRGDGAILDFKPDRANDRQRPIDEYVGKNIGEFLTGDAREGAKRGIERALATQAPQLYEFPLDRNGKPRHREARIVASGEDEVLVIVRDVTERKRIEEELREQARCDPLTGLLNHAAIVEELRALVAEGEHAGSHVVAMTDVDGLKAINDIYGHQLGDEALVRVARALSIEDAIVGRYGGDEFVSILRACDEEAAARYRAAVLARLAEAGAVDPETGARVPIVVSIGTAIYPRDAQTVHELIQISDNAMYAARRQRPIRGGAPAFVRPLGTDRAAELVGQLVPLLTAPGDVNNKLKLVSQRLSVGAGYDAVTFSVFAAVPGQSIARNTFARAPDELVEAWHGASSNASAPQTPEAHPVRVLLEKTKRPLILEDPWNDERLWEDQRAVIRAAELRSALIAPLIWEDDVVGLIGVASRREQAFGPSDAQFLATVASQVTAIIHMSALFQELQSTSERLAQAQEESVILLAASAEAHDQTTGRHLHNLRALTEPLAKELGHSEEKAHELGLAAVLHDIGKIRVPDSVLARPGKLGEEEWEIMKHHTTWGAHFLTGHPGFELASTIARSHHERWDGTGYPDGLAGDAIPEEAAIVAVADAFDAITSDRPYRRARTIAAAMREIADNAGTQFSPRVVEALQRLHKRRELRLAKREPAEEAA